MASLPNELQSAKTFYAFLGVGAGERQFLEKHATYRYTQASIPKRRGGTRTLLVPERRLKFLQRKTLVLLQQLHLPRAPVRGFIKDRGAITNANEHQTRPYLLNLDLRNYFGAITRRLLNDQAALLADPSYTRMIVRWSGKGEARKSVEKKLPVRPWWSCVKDGVALRLRFISGSQGFVVGSIEDLPGALENVIAQVQSGELDALIVPVKKEKKVKHPTIVGKDAKPIAEPVARAQEEHLA
jgi:hypothetical protein